MAIITLEDFKSYVGIDEADTSEDVKLTMIIDAVNVGVNRYVGRNLESTEYEDLILDGTGTEALCLPNFPVTEITSITAGGLMVVQADPPNWETDEGTEYGYYYPALPEDGILFHSLCWPGGRGKIKVTYAAGYETIPADIKLGTLEMANFYRNITPKTGIAAEHLGDYSVSLLSGIDSMRGELTIPSIPFKIALDFYRVNYYSHLVY